MGYYSTFSKRCCPCNYSCCAFSLALFAVFIGCVLFPTRDPVARICFTSFWYRDTDTAFSLATHDVLEAYLNACQIVFHSLEDEPKRILLQRLANGNLSSLCTPELKPNFVQKMPHAQAHQNNKDRNDLGSTAPSYAHTGVAPLRETSVPPSQVAAALERGDIVRFDASQVLSRSALNLTLSDLAAEEVKAGAEIPIGELTPQFEPPQCSRQLRWLTSLAPTLNIQMQEILRLALWLLSSLVESRCKRNRSMKDIAAWFNKQKRMEDIPYNALRNMTSEEWLSTKELAANGNILPIVVIPAYRFSSSLLHANFTHLLGLGSHVDRTRNTLFVGATSGAFHTDMQDNVLMALTGTVEVLVFPASAFAGLPVGPLINWLLDPRFPGRRKLPFFHVILRAGEGVTIPSMSPHRVLTGNSGTIRINSFFEPRFLEMQWGISAFARCSDAYLAMRLLWLRSMTRLWNESRIVAFRQGNSAEFL